MSASPLRFLRAGPPPPDVVLLPDGLFFSRAVPITPGATAAEAASQVELALEAMSPFPLAQLYYGWFWVPGAEHAFVYAAYRRRFTTEQTEAWQNAELVAPASAALFGGTVEPATTLVLSSPEGLTAVHWETAAVPSRVVFRPLDPDATDEQRAAARDELLRTLGGSKTVVDLLVPPAVDPARSDHEMVFHSGDYVSRLPRAGVSALDVRDKGELAALRAGRKRDLVLWRVAVGCAAALVVLALGELALLGGRAWQKVRVTEVNGRAPTVANIQEAAQLAMSIHDLVTKRFLPLEMVTAVLGVNGEKKPADIVVRRIQSRASTSPGGSYSLMMELQTSNPPQVQVYRSELEKMDGVSVDVRPLPGSGDRFELTVTFKPGTLKPQAA